MWTCLFIIEIVTLLRNLLSNWFPYQTNDLSVYDWNHLLCFSHVSFLDMNSRVRIRNMTTILKILAENAQIRHFWSQIETVWIFFRKILQMDKFESADFKYDNSFLKILAPKHPNKAFLVPDLGIFIFSRNFAIRQIRGRWF